MNHFIRTPRLAILAGAAGFLAGFLALGIPASWAQESSGRAPSLGIGAAAMLSGPVGAQVVYDTEAWHAEGLLSMHTNGTTVLFVAGRFWYHLHTTAASDFSIGGGLGLSSINDHRPMTNAVTNLLFDIGAQLRAFVVPNVAVSGSAGLAITAVDSTSFGLVGQPIAVLGLTYYFR